MFQYSGGSLQCLYKYVWFYIFKRPFFKLKTWCVCVCFIQCLIKTEKNALKSHQIYSGFASVNPQLAKYIGQVTKLLKRRTS